jgi:hypothetical protein
MSESPLWQEEAGRELRCGVCMLVFPWCLCDSETNVFSSVQWGKSTFPPVQSLRSLEIVSLLPQRPGKCNQGLSGWARVNVVVMCVLWPWHWSPAL